MLEIYFRLIRGLSWLHVGGQVGLSWGLSWLHVGRLLEPKLKPKLDLSWGLSWPPVGGLGASWDTLRRSSGDLKAMFSHAKASSSQCRRIDAHLLSTCSLDFRLLA